MANSPRPTMEDITAHIERLAQRVEQAGPGLGDQLELAVSYGLCRIIDGLKFYIPGLDPDDVDQIDEMNRRLYEADWRLEAGDHRIALANALHGLALHPHDPRLWYVAADACIEYGALEEAMGLLRHALWIHPGFGQAREDLELLQAYFEEEDDE